MRLKAQSYMLILLCYLGFALAAGCTKPHRFPAQKTLSPAELSNLTARIKSQQEKVRSFYTLGTLLTDRRDQLSESRIVAGGTRLPFHIKIEIGHPWGQPLFQVLITEKALEVLSLPERKLYYGPFKTALLSSFIPGDLNPVLVWSVLRGFPHLSDDHETLSPGAQPGRSLIGKETRGELLSFEPETFLPTRVSFPGGQVEMVFSNYREDQGMYYAATVEVESQGDKDVFTFISRKTVLNAIIPESFFRVEKPPGFETHQLGGNHFRSSE
jgi:hypothetical protein